ncbi:hybrid sensor histidine kinase/response regulator transcription factor [Tamlana sp. 2201CG12-4]|uniref:hybrid sensor histidine kinase/response regulator transcription factor n=1 Tax=Tamlana sp. 2201CG12-4 TaxID=3112582 RepID=UPI002DBFAF9B|nr:two-component regulator propeller domain-containing protein [Tamlana sp. 2201CG12-4]
MAPPQDISNINLNFSHINIDNGLSNNTITSIYQSNTKEIWIGTRDGLNRYNGHDITKYYKMPNDLGSLNDNFIRDLAEDNVGRLWVATNNGISRFDRKTNKFVRYKKLEGLMCRKILVSIDGKVWVGSNEGVFVYNSEIDRFEKVKYQLQQKLVNDIGDVWNLFEYGYGKFIIASSSGFYRYSEYNHSLIRIPIELKDGLEDINLAITSIYRRKNEILIGNGANGIFSLDISNESSSIKPWMEDLFNDIAIRSIQEDGNKNLWVGTYNGIYIINKTGEINHIRPDKNHPFSLSYLSVMNIYRDQNNNMWIGTYFGGVNLYNQRQNLFKSFWPSKNNFQLTNDAVRSIVRGPGGKLWVGTQGSGIVVFNPKNGSSMPLNIPEFQSKNIHCIAMDKFQRMWVGTHKHGVFLYDSRTKIVKSISLGTNAPRDISDIFISEDDKVFISGTNNKLYLLEENKKSPITIPNMKSDNHIRGIFSYGKKLFIARINGGVLFDPRDKTFNENLGNVKIGSFLEGKIVTSFLKTGNDKVLIGTEGDGLFKIDLNNSTIDQYTISDVLINNTIYDLIQDGLGNVWATTNRGLMMFKSGTETMLSFDRGDGLPSLQFSINSSYMDENGSLYFGTINGLTYVDPKAIETNKLHLPVSIEDFKIGNTSYKYQSLNEKNIFEGTEWRSVDLKHDQNNFSISFESFYYGQEQKIKFAYRLLNYNDKWTETNTRSAEFKNLPIGDYVFEVKTCNPDGIWSDESAQLSLSIQPPWWKTWWAFVIYIGLFLLITYVTLRVISERIKIKNAVKLKEFEIKQVKELNQMKLKFFTNISHEFRTPLTLISGPIDRLISQEQDSKKSDLLAIAKRNSHRLLNLINTLLDFRKAEQGFLELSLQKSNFIDFFNGHLRSFQQAARNKNIKLTSKIDFTGRDWVFDPNKMASVIYNLIGNSIKYTQDGGSIQITLKGESNMLSFEIKDSGSGIPASNLDKIFDRFYTVEESALGANDKGFGIGLALTKEIINLHQGTIEVDSNNEGTIFHVKLPALNESNVTSPVIEQYDHLEETIYSDQKVSRKIKGKKGQLKVLLVDDNRDILHYISDGLESEYQVCIAENGKEALTEVDNFHPDIIISDVMMPELDGINFCEQVKSNLNTSHIPFIMLTAKDSVPDRLKGLESGADVYVSKPFDLSVLKVQIKNILKLQAKRHEEVTAKPNSIDPNNMKLTKLDKKFMDKLLAYVEDNIENEQLSTDVLAKELSMSNSTLYRKIRALTGKGSNEFIRYMRLKRALQLLKEQEFNISEVAYKTGFTSLSYFSTCFKKEFGMLPKEYKESASKKKV